MLVAGLLALASSAQAASAAVSVASPRMLDDFESAAPWTVVVSDQVAATLRKTEGADGAALCLDYDFNGVSGYAGLQRELPLEYPDNYQFAFQLRGDSPANDLQFKLVDASGDNVWWVNKPRYDYPGQWTPVVYKKRHIARAWGPDPDPSLRRSAKLEFTVYNSAGGKGSVCFDSLTMQPLPVDPGGPYSGRASASSALPGGAAGAAVDGKRDTAWRARLDPARPPQFTFDLGRSRELGGVVLRWLGATYASSYRLALSDDGQGWRDAAALGDGDGGADYLALPEAQARYLRLTAQGGPGADIALAEFEVKPLDFAATPNDFVRAVAAEAPRGRFPRGFSGEQPYWTVIGVDGGTDQALIGEDGAIEVGKGAFSLEPFVVSGDALVGWADARTSQTLQDGYLPIPSSHWRHPQFKLDITAFADDRRLSGGGSRLIARYRLSNDTERERTYQFVLALRPLQVNPPTQFLSQVGGVSRIRSLTTDSHGFSVEGGEGRVSARRIQASAADATLAASFDHGDVVKLLAQADWRLRCGECSAQAEFLRRFGGSVATGVDNDRNAMASGALVYRVTLAPGQSREFAWSSALIGEDDGRFVDLAEAAERQRVVAQQWRDKLDRVKLRVPASGRHVVDTLRTALAHMLISRTGPRLQPGTRSYARAWIRDGAMINEGLLRLGREDVAEQFLRWYAPYQFANGKVPCCVDDRGSDPVPENDSHGELIFAIAEQYRYDRNRELLGQMWPHVVGAVRYMDQLRASERTEANRARDPAFYGMMPASISHEGYSAKPMHSYWDNFWALRGYKDAVEIAHWLGKDEDARAFAASRDQFRADLYASIGHAARRHGIDYIPGAAELGDFDATSTTIALAPGGEQGWLPQPLLDNTFQRYWKEFVDRRDGRREWKDYTPYELRTVGSFVRLGWRERAHEALDFFFKDQQPRGWNQWAEVVSRTPRKPFFVGDLPHAWVESDYVRSVLEMFAYTRDLDRSLVLAAGVPADWLEGEGVTVSGLRTPYGALGYRLRRSGSQVVFELDAGLRAPPGGLALKWPLPAKPGRTLVDGKAREWKDGELRLERTPARVTVEVE
ncbi:discoidin domain-containing protein [Lysobacter enzymogenes]|uniref:discoidin domain-containing protein n=1 Tax=Lysobacter enzymogenes TaxID=69 RepID=UPI001AF3837F|nr:discoidin domain-containing protein [Lysobacter enzymogenes]